MSSHPIKRIGTPYLTFDNSVNRDHFRKFILALLGKLGLMLQVRRERDQLRRLDLAAQEDIGISENDLLREIDRPFWDVPVKRRF